MHLQHIIYGIFFSLHIQYISFNEEEKKEASSSIKALCGVLKLLSTTNSKLPPSQLINSGFRH